MDPKSINIKQPFWSMTLEETLHIFQVGKDGLSEEEIKNRLKYFGHNEIKDGKQFSGFKLFLNQFRSPFIFILIFAGLVTFFLKHWIDMGVIFAAVFVNVALGFYQENKAENVLELLKSYVKTRSRVRRSGRDMIIDSSQLVPGDVIRIRQGDKVPVDGRIIFINNFEVDESVLTGESEPVDKKTGPVAASVSIGDRVSMVFSGTLAVSGFCDAVVTATGNNTEFGKITALLSKKEKTETPLQLAMSRFSFWTGLILLVLTIILFSLGLYLHFSPLDMFLIVVAVGVSAVPEGLPIALTVILAVGVERLAKRKGVVRKLLAAETLGSTDLILTDKTGTLTQAKMELAAVIPYKDSSADKINGLLTESLTTVDVVIQNPDESSEKWELVGNLVEVALVEGAAKRNILINDVLSKNQVFERLPFSSHKKYAASIHSHEGIRRVMVMGAPEILVQFTNLSEEEIHEVVAEIDERAFSGERILGVISKEPCSENQNLNDGDFKDFNFDGLITFQDPLRPGVFEAMGRISEAGVRTIIVTGDHQGTAEAVAREIGLIDGKGGVLTGDDLNHLSKEEWSARADEITVYARVTPEQKVQIAKLYQEKGHIVAMTGDGVNDAPALEAANIGVALGSGTDVTKSAADLVILDDNYETIVVAIERGRMMLDNIRKVIVYLLSNSLDEVFLISGAMFTGLALPLTATQILFVNFFNDSFPAIAFAFEKGIDKSGHNPRRLTRNLFDPQMKFLLFGICVATSALLFVTYFMLLAFGFSPEIVRTFIFTSFATYSLLVSFSLRSLNKSIFSYNPFSNLYLSAGVLFGVTMTLAAVYWPPLSNILGTTPLPLNWIIGVGVFGALNVLIIELGKWFYKTFINSNSEMR